MGGVGKIKIVFLHLLTFMAMSHPIHCRITGDVIRNPVSTESGESQYLTEFTELGFLGQGGYGCAVKCLNKLDGVTYAVKKISLRETNWPFNEVKKISIIVQGMESLQLITLVAIANAIIALVMLVAYAILRTQLVNDRFYFFKWYANGTRGSPTGSSTSGSIFFRDIRTCIMFWSWIPAVLRMSEADLIDHAGLDSVVYIRIYLLGLKILFPLAVLACTGLVPFTRMGQSHSEEFTSIGFDKFSISNVPPGLKIFWADVVVLCGLILGILYDIQGKQDHS